MDFDDTPEEAAFRAEARAWLEANAIPKGSPDDFSAGHFAGDVDPAEYIKRCRWWQGQLHEAGWAGISWPTDFGGRGGKSIEEAIFAEEQARWGVSSGAFVVALGMVAPTLWHHATPEQQQRWLAPMLRGDEVWCQLFSEPEAGSDLASLRTRATRDGDVFVVDGQKVWTSNAQHSEWGILIARTDPEAAQARRHHLLRGRDGLAGHRDPPAAPAQRRGALQRGVPRRGAHPRRPGHRRGRRRVEGGGDDAVQRARGDRRRVGRDRSRPAAGAGAPSSASDADPLFRQRFADIHIRNELLRYLKLRTRTAVSKGVRPGPEASVMKLSYSRYVKALGDLALAMQGPWGQLDHPDARALGVFQQKFLNAVQSSIGGGTDEIQRNIIGERVLGLPREPR